MSKKYKLCECFENFNTKLTKHYEEKGETLIEKFDVQSRCWLIDPQANGTGMVVVFEAKAKRGAKTSKPIKANVTAQYCPFCSKPMFEIES